MEGRHRHGKTWVCAMAQSLWKVGSSSTGILQGKWENITWGSNPQKWLFTISNRKIVLECPIFREKQDMVLPNDLLHQLLKVSCRCSIQSMFVHMYQAISFIYNLNLHQSLHGVDSICTIGHPIPSIHWLTIILFIKVAVLQVSPYFLTHPNILLQYLDKL